MKGILAFIILAAIGIAILVHLDKNKPAAPLPAAALPAAAAPAPPPQPPPQNYQPQPLTGEARERALADLRSGRPGQTRGATAAQGSTTPAPQALQSAARSTAVTIVGYRPENRSAIIDIEWTGDFATRGGDFLEAALRSGAIRDFDQLGRGHRMDPGRTVWHASYRLKF